MPASSIVREIRVPSNRERCWEVITDLDRLTSWVSILHDVKEYERLKRYEAVLEDRLGPFRLRADLDIRVSDVEEERSLHVHAEGEDRQVGSRIVVDGQLRLLSDGEQGTLIAVDGSYEVSGRVATLGASMIHSKAQKIVNEFFQNVSRDLS